MSRNIYLLAMLFALLCSGVFTGQPAFAQLHVYQDEASFFANSGPITTETFEEFPNPDTIFPGPEVEINNVIYTPQQYLEGDRWMITSHPVNPPPSSPSHNLVYSNITAHSLTFHYQTVRAFGFWLGAAVDNSKFSLSIREENGTITSLDIVFPSDPASTRLQYWGFVSDAGIRQVNIDSMQTSTGPRSNWGYDDVSISAVPEPSIFAFALTALLGVSGFASRRVRP
jgi:hypothetical protein